MQISSFLFPVQILSMGSYVPQNKRRIPLIGLEDLTWADLPLPLCLFSSALYVTHSTPAMLVFLMFFKLGECAPALGHLNWLFLQISLTHSLALEVLAFWARPPWPPSSAYPLHHFTNHTSHFLFCFSSQQFLLSNMLHICILNLL